MNLGNKLLNLRKKNNLSQENVADKLNVTRQTVSNWELGETTPSLVQARDLSKLYRVSLDELVDNDIKSVLEEKVSNTEKLAGIIIKILKVIGLLIGIFIVFMIAAIILFTFFKHQPENSDIKNQTIKCSINDQNYTVTYGNNDYFYCDNCDNKMNIFLSDITDYANMENSEKNVKKYFSENGGKCE